MKHYPKAMIKDNSDTIEIDKDRMVMLHVGKIVTPKGNTFANVRTIHADDEFSGYSIKLTPGYDYVLALDATGCPILIPLNEEVHP